MILLWIILIPLAGGLLAWVLGLRSDRSPRRVCLASLGADLVILLYLWFANLPAAGTGGVWIAQVSLPWLPRLGIGFHLAMDGISLLLVLLTVFLGMAAVISSWGEIGRQAGFFHFNLMAALTGIMGVFVAVDLFLFYFFWELMLVPMYFLIALWGHERRLFAAVKFFIFTQVGGLLMLAAILGLYFIHGRETGTYTFDYVKLLGIAVPEPAARLILLGFLAAFLVKLPAVPFHAWLPDAHTEAPTAGSVILAGLLLKTGAYGLMRFALPLFPAATRELAPIAMALAVIGILYGAVLAFAQTDLKRLVAYTSISHMGFVLLGIFAFNETALQGALIQMLCHGVSTGALFILVGSIQERIHTREMGRMGGLWSVAPRLGGAWLFFALASLGLPGMGNFIGEFLVLLGTYPVSIPMTAAAAAGLILSTVYAVRMIQKAVFGPNRGGWRIADLTIRETGMMAAMMFVILWLGLYPQPFLNTARGSLDRLLETGRTELTAGLSPSIDPGGVHDSH
ncbi:MAG TPA: NADH-quinone oxidoreductase subunit M [Syntrophales bacterium]|nr:NADH-quinone oxidoreductase subunit M [Syntrophales bacterium]HRT60809.1 NADH-quinone oxidoreductase subunit M [Syntrophales bacterium]